MMDRVEIYAELSKRVRFMRFSEEQSTFETYEVAFYAKLSALTDAVAGGMIDLSRAQLLLEQFITSLTPKEGTIRI